MSRFGIKRQYRWCTGCHGTTEQVRKSEEAWKCERCGVELKPTKAAKPAVNFDNSLEAT